MSEENKALLKAEAIANGTAKEDYEKAVAETQSGAPEKFGKKAHAKAEREKKKAEARRNRIKNAAIKRERRQKEREERRKSREERRIYGGGKGGWITAVACLSVSTVLLLAAVSYNAFMPSADTTALEYAYRKSFYDTVSQVNNLDLNLAKALASKDRSAAGIYLAEASINSELAENDIQQLPVKEENKYYTAKTINQAGDLAKYLNKKILRGEELTKKDTENLRTVKSAVLALKNALASALDGMPDDYSFGNALSVEDDPFLYELKELENLSVEYPELIYDGPFSDGRDNAEMKGISGENISEERATEIFSAIFAEYNPRSVQVAGKTTGKTVTLNVTAEIKGKTCFAQFSEKGGKLLSYSYQGSCNSVKADRQAAEAVATEFMEKAGFDRTAVVWGTLENNVYTFNFAGIDGGVIIYPDLVKVRVCAETKMIIGVEAFGYYANKTERTIKTPNLSEESAQSYLHSNIAVEFCRLAIIPFGQTEERLCYEFCGKADGDTYYVYIDANTGAQIQMFMVINPGESSMLM